MAGPEFFQTPMGQRFIEGTMPVIARALTTIAKKMPDASKALPDPRILTLLNMLADAPDGECFCRLRHHDPDRGGETLTPYCPCDEGACNECEHCPSGKARDILVAIGKA